jgi:hypothetical protein
MGPALPIYRISTIWVPEEKAFMNITPPVASAAAFPAVCLVSPLSVPPNQGLYYFFWAGLELAFGHWCGTLLFLLVFLARLFTSNCFRSLRLPGAFLLGWEVGTRYLIAMRNEYY